MSAGPGHVMRTIEAAVEADPEGAFTIKDLSRLAYPGEEIEKKHRVAVIRAMRNFARRRPKMAVLDGGHQFARAGRTFLVLMNLDHLDAAVTSLRDRDIWLYRDWESFSVIADRHEANSWLLASL